MSGISGSLQSRKLGGIQRKSVSLADEPLVKSRPLSSESKFIQIYEPVSSDVDLAAWIGQNREQLEADILVHGALLLRNFHMKSVDYFEEVTQAFYGGLYSGYGDL